MTNQTLDLAIIGGGISGLATAYYAQKFHHEAHSNPDQPQPPLSLRIYEASARVGGKLQTEHVATDAGAPFIVEAGPDSFLTQKPWALQLARELGMESTLIGTNDQHRRVYVLQGNRLVPMPEGIQLIVPTRLWPFITSPLISPLGKLRMALDWFIPRKREDTDETLAVFVRRRLGKEALDKLAEPLMSGIYSAEADRQSILATFPRFRELERTHGSLMRGILAAQRARKQSGNATTQAAPKSAFVTPVQGIEELARQLGARLQEQICTGATVTRIEPVGDQAYRLTFRNGDPVHARAVVLAIPAGAAAALLHPIAEPAAQRLAAIRHVSTVTLSLAYRPGDVQHPMDGFGVVIPHSENRPINAITWTTRKFDQRAPAGHTLIRVFLGGSRNPAIVQHDDAGLLAIARAELAGIMGLHAEPLFHRLFRWQDASPQYDVGHLDLVDQIEAALPHNVFVTGSPYRGIGIPDCVHQAQNTAQAVVGALP